MFDFLGIAVLLSTVATPFYIPTRKTQGFQFLRILASTSYFLGFFWGGVFVFCFVFSFFGRGHPHGCVVVSRGFDLHFPND